MSASVAILRAKSRLTELIDSEGRQIFISDALVEYYRAKGIETLTFTVSLMPGKPAEPHLTISEAARLLLKGFPGRTMKWAMQKIGRAADRGSFIAAGPHGKRLIEPNSFKAWVLNLRDRDMELEDATD